MENNNLPSAKFDVTAFLKANQQMLAVVLLLFVNFFPTFIWMWDRWFSRDSYYSHGILVPLVCGYLIWQKKDALSQMTPAPSRWGMGLIISGLIVHLLSSVLRVYFTSGFALLLVIPGVVLYFYGFAILRQILFPLFFIFFMIPLPMVVIVNLSFRLKLFAAAIAAQMLNGMGLPALQEGSIIRMPHAQVVVDDVCSGLRSLISLTALGSIFAYWLKGSIYKKIFLFLTTIPIAVVTNVCRVLILAFISEVWGSQYASGFVHDATGFLVFVLAFILLYALSRLIE